MRREVKELSVWAYRHQLILNVDKTKEMTTDFRLTRQNSVPYYLVEVVERASSIKYLEVHLSDDLFSASNNIANVKKAQQLHPHQTL